MITVVLIGPDGAGKSTISANLNGKLARPVRTVYMGINPDASNHMLPTARALRALRRAVGKSPNAGGPREHGSAEPRADRPLKRMLSGARAWAGMTNRIAEEWYRVGAAAVYRLRGCQIRTPQRCQEMGRAGRHYVAGPLFPPNLGQTLRHRC